MKTFAPGTDITLSFDMVHPETREVIDPVSAVFGVYDDAGVELLTNQVVAVSGGELALDVTIPAAQNGVLAAIEARTVVLSVTSATGMTTLTESYVLETFAFLQIPAESAMTLPQSLMLSRQLAQNVIEIWADMTDAERQAALRESWTRITRLPFQPWRQHEEIPSTVPSHIASGKFTLTELSASEWAMLPDHFKNALKRAQLVEAAVIMEGDPTWDRRQEGLISKTVGESSEMFSSRKSAINSMSPKSFREISGYVRRSITIGRA